MQKSVESHGMSIFHCLILCSFIDYDVCHDTNDRSRSFGALVATMDMQTSTHYFGAVTAHFDDIWNKIT